MGCVTIIIAAVVMLCFHVVWWQALLWGLLVQIVVACVNAAARH